MQELDWKLIIPSAVALISLLISLLVALRNWGYSKTAVRYSARNQYMNALFDIDRHLIARSELWAIYDDHPPRSNDPVESGRREAFLYLHINLFETVFTD